MGPVDADDTGRWVDVSGRWVHWGAKRDALGRHRRTGRAKTQQLQGFCLLSRNRGGLLQIGAFKAKTTIEPLRESRDLRKIRVAWNSGSLDGRDPRPKDLKKTTHHAYRSPVKEVQISPYKPWFHMVSVVSCNGTPGSTGDLTWHEASGPHVEHWLWSINSTGTLGAPKLVFPDDQLELHLREGCLC